MTLEIIIVELATKIFKSIMGSGLFYLLNAKDKEEFRVYIIDDRSNKVIQKVSAMKNPILSS